MRPFRSSPALGSFYSSPREQIGTVLHADLIVRHQFLGGDGGGDGTSEILLDSPDCVEIRLQGVS